MYFVLQEVLEAFKMGERNGVLKQFLGFYPNGWKEGGGGVEGSVV